MKNENLHTAMSELMDAIRGITLGSIETEVMCAAGEALIHGWNSHNSDDPIDEGEEIDIFNESSLEDFTLE